jgi:hypothetical protein
VSKSNEGSYRTVTSKIIVNPLTTLAQTLAEIN